MAINIDFPSTFRNWTIKLNVKRSIHKPLTVYPYCLFTEKKIFAHIFQMQIYWTYDKISVN